MYAMRDLWMKWQNFISQCENLAEKWKKRKPDNSGFCI